MFEKILYPTDFSDASKEALQYIKQLRQAGTKQVTILHVIDERDLSHINYVAAYLDTHQVERNWLEASQEEIGAMEEELKQSGFSVKARIERGIPFREILRVEEEENVSAVVIGSHGKRAVQEMFLGSVSEKVVRKSKKPVLVVRRYPLSP